MYAAHIWDVIMSTIISKKSCNVGPVWDRLKWSPSDKLFVRHINMTPPNACSPKLEPDAEQFLAIKKHTCTFSTMKASVA